MARKKKELDMIFWNDSVPDTPEEEEDYEKVYRLEYADDLLVCDCPWCDNVDGVEGRGPYLTCKFCGRAFMKSTISLLLYGEITKEQALRDSGYLD